MVKAKNGDRVKVHYTGKLTNGEVFDSSLQREPLEFDLGKGQMIKGFEQAVLGMGVGEEKTVDIASPEAYGEIKDEMIFPVDRNNIPEHIDLKVGMQLNAQTSQGYPIQVTVKEVQLESVVVDANHPLAGKDLVFDIKLVELNSPDDADKKPLLYD